MNSFKSFLLALATLASFSGFSQGTINFATKITGSVDSKVYYADTGIGVSGADGYFVQLYVGANAGSLVAAGSPVALRSDAGVGYVVASIVTTSLPGGSTALVQMRAWKDAPNYETASSKGSTSNISVLLGDNSAKPPTVPASLIGLPGIAVGPVPEPTTASLAAVGCLAVAMLGRNKRHLVKAA
jgi:hypothetical protein